MAEKRIEVVVVHAEGTGLAALPQPIDGGYC